jgi:hypothetical protein
MKAATAIILPLLLSLCGCSVERTEVARSPSPNGRLTAVLVREAGGGAAGSSLSYVYLADSNSSGASKRASLTASRCDSLSMKWINARVLQIEYSPPCAIKQFENLWYSRDAIANARAADVELVLQRKGI